MIGRKWDSKRGRFPLLGGRWMFRREMGETWHACINTNSLLANPCAPPSLHQLKKCTVYQTRFSKVLHNSPLCILTSRRAYKSRLATIIRNSFFMFICIHIIRYKTISWRGHPDSNSIDELAKMLEFLVDDIPVYLFQQTFCIPMGCILLLKMQ